MMFTWVRRLVAPPVLEDEDQARNAVLLNTFLWATFGIIVASAPSLITFNTSASGVFLSAVIVVLFALAVLGLIRVLHRGHVRLVTILAATLLWAIFTVTIYIFGGIRNTTASGYLLVIFIAGFLLGGRSALFFGLLSMLSALAVFYAERYWTLPIPLTSQVDFDNLAMLVALSGLMVVLVGLARRTAADALDRARRNERALAESNRELQASRGELEIRAQKLERRAVQLRAAAEVARDATTARDLNELLNRAVNLVQERFGFYHAGIFLVDDLGEYAVLRAATGEAGRQMLEREHRLKVGEVGIVGHVTATGLSRVALDVGEDAVYFDNPLLPETRSEMALPLRLGEEIVGALDVQSQEAEAFDDEDVTILQTMADQLAITIQNIRLVREAQQTVRELEAASGRYIREAWRAEQLRGYRYRGLGVEPVSEHPPQVRQAWQQERSVISTQSETGAANNLAVPLKLRDQVLGVLNLRFEGEPASPDMVKLVEDVADRLAMALESARLFGETQSRARREQTIRQITEQMRRAVDVETILQTTITRLGEAVGAPRVYVRLGAEVEKEE